jgi:hypothetical protein
MGTSGRTLCIGYRCVCGERVEVTHFFYGEDVINDYPAEITVSCSNGHVGTRIRPPLRGELISS